MPKQDISNRELFDLLTNKIAEDRKNFASMDQRFESMDQRFESMDQRFVGQDDKFRSIDKQFKSIDCRFDEVIDMIQNLASHMDSEFDKVWKELRRINSTFVTKDYLDRKLWGFKEDVLEMIDSSIKGHEAQMHVA